MNKEEKTKTIFEELYSINVNDYVETKKDLKYLSWSYAIAEITKRYPDVEYYIERFGEDRKPYLYDASLGYMVFTRVRLNGQEKEMWLPVMDSNNKAMLDHPYTYDTKFKKDVKVEAASMFDVNKTIMRCLVKNFAMFGLGLYIYNGEDLPEEEKVDKTVNYKQLLMDKLKELNLDVKQYAKDHKVNANTTQAEAKALLNELTEYQKTLMGEEPSDDDVIEASSELEACGDR